MSHFYKPWKRQKTFGFLMFFGDTEIKHWVLPGLNKGLNKFSTNVPLLYPSENIRKPTDFWCFHGEQKFPLKHYTITNSTIISIINLTP